MKCLSIHLTDLCNSECTFCVVASPFYTKDTVDYEDVISFLESHRGQGYDVVNLHGGEPTIHPRFLETLQTIRELGYPQIHLQTNGIRLAKREFTEKLVDLNVTKFIVSLHGDTPEYHDSQTFTKGGLKKTLQGMRHVHSLGVHIRTNTVITHQNLERLPQISRLACEVGVSHVNYSNLHPVGSARLSRSRQMATFEEIRRYLYPAVDLVVGEGRTVTLEGFPHCTIGGGRERLHLCNEYRDIKMLVRGDVLEHYDTFMKEQMAVFGPPCQGCPWKEDCTGVYPEYIEYNGWSEFGASLASSRDRGGKEGLAVGS
ncbi:MAG TPA: radical SAM protein [Acidobacteriota bacterium]|nr:radical SAM protein [Acidobacteriota bacterium]